MPSPRLTVPLDGLDPVAAAPLADAGLTPYHAIRRALGMLRPGTSAIVIGVGGLGHVAVQLLKALGPARVVAVDRRDEALEVATRGGADVALQAAGLTPYELRRAAGGRGAALVLDCVGSDETLTLAAGAVAPGGHVSLLGLAGGTFPMRFGGVPLETSVDLLQLGHALGARGGRRARPRRRHLDGDRAHLPRRRPGRLRAAGGRSGPRPARRRTGPGAVVMRLEGRIAVVTGGGSGIGEAICHRLAAEGARVAAMDLRLDAARQTIAAIGAGLAVHADVSDSDAVDAALARVEHELGAIDILVNNAGAVGGAHLARVMPLLETQRLEALSGGVRTPLDALVRLSDDEWRRLLAVHLDGTFFCTRAAARLMAPRGSGAIVNMSSVCGIEGCTGHPHYSAAKAAILGFTRAVAKELIVQGVRVNAVAPGHVDTSTLKGQLDESRQVIADHTPAGRLARPEEIAATVAFLASEDAAYYVGATLSPNGGLVTAV